MKSFRSTCEVIARAKGEPIQPHHALLIDALQDLADLQRGLRDDVPPKLMVMMPPGSAKSTISSQYFPFWSMMAGTRIDLSVGSYSADLAIRHSKATMQLVRDFGGVIFGHGLDTENVAEWAADTGSTYKAVGVGGPITGRRLDISIIDDPVKSAAEAASQILRDEAWNWALADLSSRFRPGGVMVLIMTRWHEDDLAGRFLLREPSEWRVIRIRAESLGEHDDPLHRPAGAFLWDDDPGYRFGKLLRQRKRMHERTGTMSQWQALYQQDPRPADGAVFDVSKLKVRPVPDPGEIKRVVRYWDFAATDAGGKSDPDYTVGAKVAEMQDGSTCILDIVRFRGSPEVVEQRVVRTAREDGRSVVVGLSQDPGQAGKFQALYYARQLSGFIVRIVRESGDKATRAAPLASQVNIGAVRMVAADWNTDLVNEFEFFPNGRHDDQVDACAGGFALLFNAPRPAVIRHRNWRGR